MTRQAKGGEGLAQVLLKVRAMGSRLAWGSPRQLLAEAKMDRFGGSSKKGIIRRLRRLCPQLSGACAARDMKARHPDALVDVGG